MARNSEQIQAEIDAATTIFEASDLPSKRLGIAAKLGKLRIELKRQRVKEAQDPGLGVGLWTGNPTRLADER